MKTLEQFLDGVNTLAVVCNQWGDTGKGKFGDFFAEWADIIARGTGGANAGHTVKIKDKTYVFHIIPSGIIYDSQGKTSVIGNGVAFDPRAVLEELKFLKDNSLSYNNLRIAYNAKLVLPQHLVMDRVKESNAGENKIGTTGRGIGPVYTDHYARIGLTVNDVLNTDLMAKKLKRNLKDKLTLLSKADPEVVKQVMQHPHLENGIFYSSADIFNVDAIVEKYSQYGKELKELIADTDAIVSVTGSLKINQHDFFIDNYVFVRVGHLFLVYFQLIEYETFFEDFYQSLFDLFSGFFFF